jgi:enoyl-CoA hydratase/carnithine racemase
MPTVCAVGGHAFGAGLMIALCHDVRVMRGDRGFLCANEVELGLAIPEPELALFRHKVPMNAFYETVMLARRWSGPDALANGIVQHLADAEEVLPKAIEVAAGLAHLGRNREVFGWMKEHIHGEHAAINNAHGAAYMLRNSELFAHGPGTAAFTG